MLLDPMTNAIKRLIALGREQGHVTVAELDAALSPGQVSAEMVEDTAAMLSDLGIGVVERGDSEDGEAADAGPRGPLGPSPQRSGAEAPLDGAEDRVGEETGRTQWQSKG